MKTRTNYKKQPATKASNRNEKQQQRRKPALENKKTKIATIAMIAANKPNDVTPIKPQLATSKQNNVKTSIDSQTNKVI